MEGNCNYVNAVRAEMNNVSTCDICGYRIYSHIALDGSFTVCFSTCDCGKYVNNSKEMAVKHNLYYPWFTISLSVTLSTGFFVF